MTKKAPAPLTGRRHFSFSGWKLLIVFATLLCFISLVGLQFLFCTHNVLASPRTRSRISHGNFDAHPKIAFLFLARRKLSLDFLWGSFFENAGVGKFSIYIHSAPGFVFDESTSRSHFFYNRQLSKSIQVQWGESSMIAAESLLLQGALQDRANQRFVLLSDSCAPLYNFSYIYNYLMASPKSFVDSFHDVKDSRYHPKMAPVIPKNKWRKGSQWISLVRSHAEVIVDDQVVFPLFKKLCKRRPPLDVTKEKQINIIQEEHNCIPDEHYVQTLFAMHELEDELERRTLTYSLWNQSVKKLDNKTWHPVTFNFADASPKQIKEIKGPFLWEYEKRISDLQDQGSTGPSHKGAVAEKRIHVKDISHVDYESEHRTEWCKTNSTFVPCFLFARKFSSGAAMRLLRQGLVGTYDTTSVLNIQ